MRLVKNYLVPESIEQAMEMLKSPDYKIIAGGSKINSEKTGEYGLIDIRKCGLNYIKVTQGILHIGAMTRISELLDNKDFCGLGESFVNALKSTGHAIVRNQITIGGSVSSLTPWFNLATLLLLADANIIYIDENNSGSISFREYCDNSPREFIRRKIIKEITIPIKKYEFKYIRFSQTEVDYAPLYVACSGKTPDSLKIAISGCLPEPKLFDNSDFHISDLSSETVEKSCNDFIEKIKGKVISTNVNFSREYIIKILPRLIKESIMEEK